MKQKRFAIIGLCLYVILFSTALTSVKFEEVQRRWTNKFVVKELGFIGYAIFDLTMYTKNLYTTSVPFRQSQNKKNQTTP